MTYDHTSYMRDWRRKNRMAQRSSAAQLTLIESEPLDVAAIPALPVPVEEQAEALIAWAESKLIVPEGPLRGEKIKLDDWQKDWLRGALAGGIREAGLSIARKNGKSALIAILMLGHMVGPLNVPNWKAIVTSLTGDLAKEMRRQIEVMAEAAGFTDLAVYRSPTPGRVVGWRGAELTFLAADKSSGHARGADIACIDEAGLLQEKHRELWNAIFTSISGRDGRFFAISIQGDGPMFAEMKARSGSKAMHWTEYAADPAAAIDDKAAWQAANPGLATGIKSTSYMADAAAKAVANPADQATFRAYDLNQPQSPTREMILELSQYQKLMLADAAPPPHGPFVVGVDLGGSSSMTAAALYWYETGRLEVHGAFPEEPNIGARAEADAVGDLYQRMLEAGELETYSGMVTPVAPFLAAVIGDRVPVAICADRYRKAEATQFFATANLPQTIAIWRGQGWRDGAEDIREFQREVLTGAVKIEANLILPAAIKESTIIRDSAGNPKLEKHRARGRIDALAATILAVAQGRRIKLADEQAPSIGYGGLI